MSFRITKDPDASPRLALLTDSLRGIEGDLENVPVDHMLDDWESGRAGQVSVIKDVVEIDVPLILAI